MVLAQSHLPQPVFRSSAPLRLSLALAHATTFRLVRGGFLCLWRSTFALPTTFALAFGFFGSLFFSTLRSCLLKVLRAVDTPIGTFQLARYNPGRFYTRPHFSHNHLSVRGNLT
jgi:hypothetical protein